MGNERDGVWRTIRGRRVFIGKGETLGQAMAKSGKFTRTETNETKYGYSTMQRFGRSHLSKNKGKAGKEYHKGVSKALKYSDDVFDKDRQDPKNRIHEYERINSNSHAKKRTDMNWKMYSDTDRRELRREDLQKKLAEYNYGRANEDLEKNSKEWENRFNQGYNKYDDLERERKDAQNRFETARIKGNIDTQEKSDKIIADYKAKKQSNNKIVDKASNEITNRLLDEDYKNENIPSMVDLEMKKRAYTSDYYDKDTLDKIRAKSEHDLKISNGKQSNNKYEKQYDSVVDRYNKDEKFRDMLKKEHDKTIEATRKEIKEYLRDKDNFNNNFGIESEDDLYNTINENYFNVSREDFDKAYKEENDKYMQDKNITRRVEKNFDNYGRVDRDEAINNEVEKAVKEIKNNKVENNDLQNEYINYSKDLNLDPNKQSTKNKFLNDYGKNYVQNKGIKDYEQEMEKVKNTIKSFKEKKQSNNHDTTNRILESGKVNQKTLKNYAKDGLATDISNYSDKELDKLEKKHGKIRAIKTTNGVYGMNGGLFRGEKSGEYFVITSRSGNLYRLV